MSLIRQLVFSLVVLAVAAVVWVRFFPGAPATLERWGLDWAMAAAPERSEAEGDAAPRGRGGFSGQSPTVIAEAIGDARINDRLTAIGTGRALSSVSVRPFAAGRLTELFVRSGSRVDVGDALATLDSDAEEISLDRARFALEDAQARLERVSALRASNTVSTVQVTEAELAVSNAQLELRDAELALQRRSIVAPIAGIVGILPVSVGNYVGSETEIATIDDRSEIVVDFWVPERFASTIEVGQSVSAVSVARPGELFSGEVTATDNRIDAQSRTLRVQASLENPEDTLRAGMSFEVSMSFPGESYPSVDPLAIQWGTDGAYIWVVEGGQARRTPVRIIQRNTDSVLVSGDLPERGTVVTEGLHLVREGATVNVADDSSGGSGPRPDAEPVPQAAAETKAGT